MIVMPDAEPSQVVNSLIGAAYGSAGERCMAISVAVCVGDEVADNPIKDLQSEIEKMSVGNGMSQPEPHMGPLVSRVHADKVLGYIDSGVEEGATLVVDGRDFKVTGHDQGYFVGPTLFDHVKAGMRIYEEEIFGPVLSVVRVNSYEEALNLINAHEYGNGTAIFTRDGDTARNFCAKMSRSAWLALTCRFRCPWHSTASVDGSARCSDRFICMVLMVFVFLHPHEDHHGALAHRSKCWA